MIEREFYRTDLPLPVSIHSENVILHVKLFDVSGGGLSFLHERPFLVNRHILINLPILNQKGFVQLLHLEAKIVNIDMIHPQKYRMGVKFEKITEKDRDSLIRFVNGCTGKKRSGACRSCSMRQEKNCNSP